MALPAVAGATFFAADLYQLCQPSGNTATGHYKLGSAAYANGAIIGMWIANTSRAATPVSASIDTSIIAPTGGAGTPAADTLKASGFFVAFSVTAAQLAPNCAGNWTIQF